MGDCTPTASASPLASVVTAVRRRMVVVLLSPASSTADTPWRNGFAVGAVPFALCGASEVRDATAGAEDSRRRIRARRGPGPALCSPSEARGLSPAG